MFKCCALILILVGQAQALAIFDMPSKHASIIKQAKINDITLEGGGFVKVQDKRSGLTGYVKLKDYQSAVAMQQLSGKNPDVANMLTQQQSLQEQTDYYIQNIKNRQAQMADLKKKLMGR